MEDISSQTKLFCRRWLTFTVFILLSLIFVGGITRLTDSGLSMTEWKPILGTIPPMNADEWQQAFDKYKKYPEFRLKKSSMNLDEFKSIFFWEYFHRILGRLIGVVFFLPFLYLVIRKKLNRFWGRRFLIAFLLGGSQGLLGWFMVKSGLVEMPDVSHFRLAAHFTLALFILVYIYWHILKLKNTQSIRTSKKIPGLIFFCAVLLLQIIYGAFVAGLDAGIGYNTFPLMGSSFAPKGLLGSEFFSHIIHTTFGVQYIHRCLGFVVLGFSFFYLRKSIIDKSLRSLLLPIVAMIMIQFLLGVGTLVMKVPISLASMHQMGACILVLATTRAFFLQKSRT